MFTSILTCVLAVSCGAPTSDAKPEANKNKAVAQKPQAAAEKKSEPKQVTVKKVEVKDADVEATESPEQPKVELLEIEEQVIAATNAERARYGLAAFEVDAGLMESARSHASWMTVNRSLVHTRMPVAENIAMGYPTSDHVVRGWMNSSGHRANILNGGHRRIGVGVYRTEEGQLYWCQQFSW